MRKVIPLNKNVPSTWQDALKEFLLFKKAQGLSQTTLGDYEKHVSLFFKRYPNAYESQEIRQAVLEYMSQEVMPATFNLRLSYLKAFFDWAVTEGIFSDNPLKGIKRRKADNRIVNIDAETLARLISLPDRKTFAGLRDYALILLTLDTGIRPKEAFSLLPDDFNMHAMEVYVRPESAKTRIARTLPISPPTAKAVRDLLAARHPAWKSSVPVFCTCDGTPMTALIWNDRMRKYSRELGVKVRPYDLRHCFALYYLRNGGNALALQRMMGHSDLSMTKRYVALTQEDLQEQHAMASPLNMFLPKRDRVRKVDSKRSDVKTNRK